jgi:hypothetical protein
MARWPSRFSGLPQFGVCPLTPVPSPPINADSMAKAEDSARQSQWQLDGAHARLPHPAAGIPFHEQHELPRPDLWDPDGVPVCLT